MFLFIPALHLFQWMFAEESSASFFIYCEPFWGAGYNLFIFLYSPLCEFVVVGSSIQWAFNICRDSIPGTPMDTKICGY